MRRLYLIATYNLPSFQSTHPMRGATQTSCIVAKGIVFQSTHPMRGATRRRGIYERAAPISIHAPHAGCDAGGGSFSLHLGISIHAPHAGCDSDCRITLTYNAISIHAPHAGCDWRSLRHRQRSSLFQSTHPMRGATQRQKAAPSTLINFNPRTPCGVRQMRRCGDD